MFSHRPGIAPDLVYASDGCELQVEITAGYYDGAHAEFLWKNAYGAKDAPVVWERLDAVPAEKALAQAIVKQVSVKCKKRYGANTLLLVEVPPGITAAEALAELLTRSTFPSVIPFTGVYVVGRFPITSQSNGGYRVLPIKPLSVDPALTQAVAIDANR